MGKLWGGRFEKGLDEDAIRLSYSLHVDKRLFPYDIQVNQAHRAHRILRGWRTVWVYKSVSGVQLLSLTLQLPNCRRPPL